MTTNIYNMATGQTGYQVPGAPIPAGWAAGTPPQPKPNSGGLNASSVSDLQGQIRSGAITPNQAVDMYLSSSGLGGNSYQLQQVGGKTAILSAILNGLGQVTSNGRMGVYSGSGNFVPTSTQYNTSITTGSGTTSTSSNGGKYTVKSGDTLGQIASRNGVSLQQLLALNPQYQANPNLIRPGETVNLGGSSVVGGNQGTMGPVGGQGGGMITVGGISIPSTGNKDLDTVLSSIAGLADGVISSGYTIPQSLQITPELTQQFLDWAHQAVDPQTKQLIDAKKANMDASLKNMAVQFELSKGQTIQDFGTSLATEQNASGNAGTAFSGLRGLNERNMANTTNRTLESLASNTEANIGGVLRSTAADVGANNQNFSIPGNNFSGVVSLEGGSRGSSTGGRALDFNYNPGLYQVGNIPTSQNTVVNQLAGNYLGQYTTLAGANTKRSMGDLIKGITGLPAGYSIPSNLQ